MRKLGVLLALCLSAVMFSCHHSDGKLSSDLVNNPKSAENPTDIKPVIQFEKTEYNFGKILQGEVVSYTFHFINAGNAPLVITGIDKSCGCTAGDYPRDPIAPGQRGDIKITYDSKGHFGFQSRTVTVISNCIPSQTSLRLKAEVMTPDQL